MNEELFNEVSEAIVNGRVRNAFDALEKAGLDSESGNTLILLKARFQRNETQNRNGLLTTETYSIEKNKINNSLLQLAQSVSENKTVTATRPNPRPITTPITRSENNTKPVNGTVNIFWMYDPSAEEYANGLKIFFQPLIRKNEISIFDMNADVTGDRDQMIAAEIQKADLVVAIVTPMFFVETISLAEAVLNEYKKPLIPILMEDVPLDETVLANLVTLPRNPRFVNQYKSSSEAYLKIYMDVKKSIDQLKNV